MILAVLIADIIIVKTGGHIRDKTCETYYTPAHYILCQVKKVLLYPGLKNYESGNTVWWVRNPDSRRGG